MTNTTDKDFGSRGVCPREALPKAMTVGPNSYLSTAMKIGMSYEARRAVGRNAGISMRRQLRDTKPEKTKKGKK